jgi:S1-C subfamily serine protease
VDSDDGLDEDGPFSRWLPPDDRLWRHPSEVVSAAFRQPGTLATGGHAVNRLWAVALVAGVVGALIASGIGAATGEFAHDTTVVRPVTNMISPNTVQTAAVTQPGWSSIYDAVAPTLATIMANSDDGETTTSAMLWRSDGHDLYILTDENAIAGATSVQVTMAGSGSSYRGRVVGVDPQSGVAVVEVRGVDHTSAVLGRMTDLRPAEQVAAIGAEGAVSGGGSTFTAGQVSGLYREVHVSDGPTMLGMIAISGASPPPDGSAVVDPSGAVVGLTTSVQPTDSSDRGTTYAIPIDVAQRVADEMVLGRGLTHPWLGVVQADDVPSATAAQLGIPGGAYVDEVMPGSPAARLGIHAGDVITAVNGSSVGSAASLLLLTDACQPGHSARLSYLERGRTATVSVDVITQPNDVIP